GSIAVSQVLEFVCFSSIRLHTARLISIPTAGTKPGLTDAVSYVGYAVTRIEKGPPEGLARMARHVRSSKIETRTQRLKLAVDSAPYFARIGRGLAIGYRRNQTAGTWIVRAADGKGGNWTRSFATADDFEEADGDQVLDFWGAQDRARQLARGKG